MDFVAVLAIVKPVVLVVLGVAAIWLVVEIALMVRKSRKTVEELKQQLEPSIASVNAMADSLEPAVAKIDPLMDRVTLTMDAANLEIMRIDTILEDVGEMTGTLTGTVETIDELAAAPANLVENVSTKVSRLFKPAHASVPSKAVRQPEVKATERPVPRQKREQSAYTTLPQNPISPSAAEFVSERDDEERIKRAAHVKPAAPISE